jgi:hypothetical protein
LGWVGTNVGTVDRHSFGGASTAECRHQSLVHPPATTFMP